MSFYDTAPVELLHIIFGYTKSMEKWDRFKISAESKSSTTTTIDKLHEIESNRPPRLQHAIICTVITNQLQQDGWEIKLAHDNYVWDVAVLIVKRNDDDILKEMVAIHEPRSTARWLLNHRGLRMVAAMEGSCFVHCILDTCKESGSLDRVRYMTMNDEVLDRYNEKVAEWVDEWTCDLTMEVDENTSQNIFHALIDYNSDSEWSE